MSTTRASGYLSGVALVTGAASGIGRAVAHVFVQEGCTRLILADVNEAGLNRVADELLQINPLVQTCITVCDVSLESSVDDMIKKGVEAFGGIHYAVNNAGVGSSPRAKTHELPVESWDRVQSINQRGVWLCQRAQIRQMLKQEPMMALRAGSPGVRGAIVDLSSIFAFAAIPESGAYSATKAAIIGMVKTDAVAYAKDGIRINAVCPGSTLTELLEKGLREGAYSHDMTRAIPLGRFAHPEEIAHGIVFLTGEKASFITGETVIIDGGALSFYNC